MVLRRVSWRKRLRTWLGVTGASLIASLVLTGCDKEEERCVYWPGDGFGCSDQGCFSSSSECPPSEAAESSLLECDETGSVESGPTRRGDDCCYQVVIENDGGGSCNPMP